MGKGPEGFNQHRRFSPQDLPQQAEQVFDALEGGIQARPEFQTATAAAYFEPPGSISFMVGDETEYEVKVDVEWNSAYQSSGESGVSRSLWLDKKPRVEKITPASAAVYYKTNDNGFPTEGSIAFREGPHQHEDTPAAVEGIKRAFSDLWQTELE